MQRLVLVTLSCLFLSAVTYSQPWSPNDYYLHAGIGFPSNPDRFFDYWSPGLTLGGGLGFKVGQSTAVVILVDYARFTVDEERFFKGIQLSSSENSITGGVTNIVAVSPLFRYFPKESQIIPIFLFAGGSLAFSSIGQTTATYSGYSVSQDSETHVGFSLVLGGGLSFAIAPTTDCFVQGRFALGLTDDDRANSHFSPITVGIRTSL